MMIVLFVILILVFLAAGYKLLEQVDFFLTHHLVTDNREALETDVMWFIDTPLSRRLNPQLLSIGVTVSTLGGNESVYFKGVHCKMMCVQSGDDRQNAMVCAAWKLYGNCDDVLALCKKNFHYSVKSVDRPLLSSEVYVAYPLSIMQPPTLKRNPLVASMRLYQFLALDTYKYKNQVIKKLKANPALCELSDGKLKVAIEK